MKKLSVYILLLIIFIFVISTGGCTQTPFEIYENFSDDMDLRARAEDYLSKAKNGDTSAFFEDEVNTYIQDIRLFNDKDNTKANEISEYYILCAQNILLTIEHNRAGDTALAYR